MKKLLSLAVLSALAQAGHAQAPIKAGTVQLGGSINYAHNVETVKGTFSGGAYTSDYAYNTLALSPYVGFFIADNLSLGLNLSYSTSNTSYTYAPGSGSSNRDGASQFRVGPVLQYYHMLTDQFGFTGAFGGGYEHDSRPTASGTGSSYDLKSNGFYSQITPGIIFLPIPKLGIGASVGGLAYNRLSVTSNQNTFSSSDDHVSTFGANFGLDQLTFSGTYFFRH